MRDEDDIPGGGIIMLLVGVILGLLLGLGLWWFG